MYLKNSRLRFCLRVKLHFCPIDMGFSHIKVKEIGKDMVEHCFIIHIKTIIDRVLNLSYYWKSRKSETKKFEH